MSTQKQRSRIVRQISLSPQENQTLQKRAESAGMPVSPFIKRQALSGSVKVLNLPPLSNHADVIGKIAHDVRIIVSTPHPDRWLYQADLEKIEDSLDSLLIVEKNIQEEIRHRMK